MSGFVLLLAVLLLASGLAVAIEVVHLLAAVEDYRAARRARRSADA